MNTKEAASMFFNCLLNNDPSGAMDALESYLNNVNKIEYMKDANLHKSTLYSALKHRNPTIKTLAKIMYSYTQSIMAKEFEEAAKDLERNEDILLWDNCIADGLDASNDYTEFQNS